MTQVPDDADPVLTMTDLRMAFCSTGIAKRLELAGVDVQDFIENGARASTLYGRGYDAHVRRAVEIKLQAENGR